MRDDVADRRFLFVVEPEDRECPKCNLIAGHVGKHTAWMKSKPRWTRRDFT